MKSCPNWKSGTKDCDLHNLHCTYPDCLKDDGVVSISMMETWTTVQYTGRVRWFIDCDGYRILQQNVMKTVGNKNGPQSITNEWEDVEEVEDE